MLSVAFFYYYTESSYAECSIFLLSYGMLSHYAECHYSKSHYGECRHAESRGALLFSMNASLKGRLHIRQNMLKVAS